MVAKHRHIEPNLSGDRSGRHDLLRHVHRQALGVGPDGSRKWIFRAGLEIKSSPAIGADGTIYFGSRDRKCYAVRPDGKKKWEFRTGGWVDSSPAVATDGMVCFGSWDKVFYAVNPDGKARWQFSTAGPIVSSPAIGANGTIYFVLMMISFTHWLQMGP